MSQTTEPQTPEQSFMGLGLALAQKVFWSRDSIKCSCDECGPGGCVACEAKRLAEAIIALCPDAFMHNSIGFVPERVTDPKMAELVKSAPFHYAAIYMKYPEKVPRIVVPKDPWEGR